jgi:signal transduction histidine kinase
MASHELRTPLSVILSSVDLLEMMQDRNVNTKENTKEQLNQIKEEINRMVTLMNELLLVSKIEADKIDFKVEQINIHSFVHALIDEQFMPWKDGRTIQLIIDTNEKTILADKFMLRHVLLNLFTNALKYSPFKKSPICTVIFNKQGWQISIEDFGIGIPENEKNHLFKSFFRASNVRQISGTGIGLVIVKFFCEKHKAKIFIKSNLGKGTKITLKFPYKL